MSGARMRLAAAALCCSALGCGVNTAPFLQPIADRTVGVGLELSIELHASDPDGDSLSFSVSSDQVPDLTDRKAPETPATIEQTGPGSAVFRWIPEARDALEAAAAFDFKVSDGKTTTVRTAQITVTAQGGSGAPTFVKPIGSGTTIQLDVKPCLDLPIEVNDTDSTQVTIGQEAPVIDGATLMMTGPFTATWHWCPTPEQVQTQDRFYLRLSADDGVNPKTLKLPPYLIVVVSSGKGTSCPGQAPTITDTPLGPQATIQDLKVDFTASDNLGLKNTPLLYWSTMDPGTPPDVSMMTPVATTRTSGNALSGGYEGIIPNPVASAMPGTMATVHYLIIARDNDDPTGGCNHATYAPTMGSYSFTVTAGGAGGLKACDACTSDAQCGGLDDNCVTIGGTLRCATACDSSGGCPMGYMCTGAAVTSVDGTSAKQCVPTAGTCETTQACTDDALEENDSRTNITNATSMAMTDTSYPNLMMCPLADGSGVDEDWYAIPVSQEGTIAVSMTSSATTDLDLELLDGQGLFRDGSFSFTSNESASTCARVSDGPIYAHVLSYSASPAAAPYALSITRTPMACACMLDAYEPDDDAMEATDVGRPTSAFSASGLTICPGNSDFWKVTLNANDTVTIDLTFNQVDSSGDIDIHLFAPDGTTDLTPCAPGVSGCMINNGQGATSNEHMVYTVPTAGSYYVVVRGYASTNTNNYDISIQVN